MKILLLSIGSRGDIEPFLAIGTVLQQAGMDVHAAFPAQFEAEARDAEIAFHPLSKRFLELLESDAGKAFMGQQGGLLSRLLQVRNLIGQMKSIHRELTEDQHSIITSLQPDRILFHPKCFYPLLWGQQNPGQLAMVIPIPGVLHPIDQHPPILPSTRNFGRTVNRMVYRLANFARSKTLPKILKPFATDYPAADLTPRGLMHYMDQRVPAWYTTSPSLFPRPAG